ncbi:tRNA pseudouridine(55) synthase TruB [Candidatus Uhrbacteria bacterium]|nr:tRNA pseudouridine(55) synthase TruB [Candidatus Uhrbacteria bacterium]
MLPQGILLIDKPAGMTSHDVIDVLRRQTGERRIGHAGTLDPFATGLLIVAVGRETTKTLSAYVGLDKEYEAEIILGARSQTLDPEGPVEVLGAPSLSSAQIETALQSLTGNLAQVPPMYSAIKIGGKKLYELARVGKEIERKPRAVHVKTFVLLSPPLALKDGTTKLHVCIECSSGTYIRALARDLGHALGTEAYVSVLRRTRIGPYMARDAHPVDAAR